MAPGELPDPHPDSDPDGADVAAVTALSDRYEAALLANDVVTLNALFADDPRVLRFGIGDMQRGRDAVVAWRTGARPIDPNRVITSRYVDVVGPGVVAVDLTFRDGPGELGRQSQTWVRTGDGWRILRAHVSVVAG